MFCQRKTFSTLPKWPKKKSRTMDFSTIRDSSVLSKNYVTNTLMNFNLVTDR